MSDDLIEEARHIIEGAVAGYVTLSKKQANALLARIGELESACYRLTEERDRLKGWADKYHDEVLEQSEQIKHLKLVAANADAAGRQAGGARVSELEAENFRLRDESRDLRARLATAEADALEKAAQEVECGCEGACLSPGNCSRDDAAAIRGLKPKGLA